MNCPKCQQPIESTHSYCHACGYTLPSDESRGNRSSKSGEKHGHQPWYRRPKSVRLAGQITASVLSGAVGAMIALLLAFYVFAPENGPLFGRRSNVIVVTAAPFEERSSLGRINASSLLPFRDSTFLVIDDLTDDAFYELKFFADGRKAEPLQRYAIGGLKPRMVEDFEGSTVVEVDGKKYFLAISSLEKDEGENTENGFVRIAVGQDGGLTGEVMPGFRSWLVANNPAIGQLAEGPDSLDVQGLAWDPVRNVVLLGIRSATPSRQPVVLALRVKDWNGPWTVDNLESAEAIPLAVSTAEKPKGVYSLVRHPSRPVFYAVVRDSDGRSGAAELYVWDGGTGGTVKLIPDLVFHPAMRPEGLAFGTIGDRPALVIVDDNGGYSVLWVDELPFLAG